MENVRAYRDCLGTRDPFTIPRQFPASFIVYSKSFFSSCCYLGENKEHRQYVTRLENGSSKHPSVRLHAGPEESFHLMSDATFEGLSGTFTVTLPPLPYMQGMFSQEPVLASGMGKKTSFRFAVEVDLRTRRREWFEWRNTRGGQVDRMRGEDHGWRLLRLVPAAGPQFGQGVSPPMVVTPERYEIVAAWHEPDMSLSKLM